MDEVTQAVQAGRQANPTLQKIWTVVCIAGKWLYLLRKVFLAVPVLYFAIKLAVYNHAHLPETVGFLLQADRSFLMEFSRGAAVYGCVGVTMFCLVMMFLSRKALYSWAISVFTLVLPVLLLASNLYPA